MDASPSLYRDPTSFLTQYSQEKIKNCIYLFEGVGNGLMYVTSMVTVQHYFDKRRAMATGIAVSGSGVGTLTFGLLTSYLLDEVGWQWTLRIQAAIILGGVLCGALYRPLPQAELCEAHEKEQLISDGEKSDYGGTDTSKTEGSTLKAQYNGADTTKIEGSILKAQYNGADTTKVGSDVLKHEDPNCCICCPAPMSEYFSGEPFRNPIFYTMCFSIIMFCFGYHVPYTYTPERAQKLGLSAGQSSFLVSIMGIANVVSRLTFGWIG